MTKIIPENEISLARLQEIFEAAFVENDIDGDGDLVVRTETNIRIFIGLSSANKLIRFTALYALEETATNESKVALANALNDAIVFVRFSVSQSAALVCDYYLPYNGGVNPLHIVTVLRLFNRIILPSLSEHDTSGLVS